MSPEMGDVLASKRARVAEGLAVVTASDVASKKLKAMSDSGGVLPVVTATETHKKSVTLSSNVTLCDNGTIYMFLNKKNGKSYVGQTWNLARRIRDHARGRGYAKLLKAALNKYGNESFHVNILATGIESQQELDSLEQSFIIQKSSRVPHGYNLASGGAYGKHSDETKRLIGDMHRGKVVSNETRQKLRDKSSGRIPTSATREKNAAGLRRY
jgi:hypothetical protein